jgi:DNA-binding MarR family transcriptional regulator
MARRSSGGKPRPMTAKEEQAWRAFVRAMLVVPRVLEADLVESSRLNFAEYHVLAYLSEQPDHAMRMSQLSELGALSPSGMTRVVERLTRQGLVKRCRSEDDGRGQVAALTDAGFERLKEAWPDHLASARSRVMDHLADLDLDVLTRALNAMNEASERDAIRKR